MLTGACKSHASRLVVLTGTCNDSKPRASRLVVLTASFPMGVIWVTTPPPAWRVLVFNIDPVTLAGHDVFYIMR